MGTYENGGQAKVFMWLDVPAFGEVSARARKVTLFSAYASSPGDAQALVAAFFKDNSHVRPDACQCVFVPYSVSL